MWVHPGGEGQAPVLRPALRSDTFRCSLPPHFGRTSMSQLEYLIPLISSIIGLGLADLAQSLRELVRPSRAVRWHWLPLLWTGILLLLVLRL